MDLSIIIVNWNTVELLRSCLRSVDAQMAPPGCEVEVIVVDNGSSDGSPVAVEVEFPRVKLIRSEENLGFARANNLGIKASVGRYVLLLNSDAEIAPVTATMLIGFMDEHPDVGVVGASLRNLDGSRQTSCDLFPLLPWQNALGRIADAARPNRGETRRDRISRWRYDSPFEVDWVLGAALMIRRAAVDQAGLLDERLFMYAEDLDWCFRVKKLGWRIFHLPDAVVYHHGGASSGTSKDLRGRLARMADDSLEYYYRKHFGLVASAGMRLIHIRKRLHRLVRAK